MSVRIYAVTMAAFSLFVTLCTAVYIEDRSITARMIGGCVGGAFALTAMVMLIVIPYYKYQKDKHSNRPFVFGGILYTIIVSAFIYGTMVDKNSRPDASSATVFSPPDCTHSATFPGHPELTKLELAGGWTALQANLFQEESFLRAECMAYEIGAIGATEQFATEQLKIFAGRQGLRDVSISSVVVNDKIGAKARGVKMISDKWATYEVLLILDQHSMITLMVGGLSTGYPQKNLSAFLKSGK